LAHHRIITAQFHRIIWVITTAYQSAKSVRIFLVLRRKKISRKQRRKKTNKIKPKLKSRIKKKKIIIKFNHAK
jgi:beta-lactamase regulating signal transducer with metallopeptidase domain